MSAEHVVLGGGPLGRAVARALVARGDDVTLAQRRPPADRVAGVAYRALDVHDVAGLRALAAGARAVYQCAQPAYTRWPQEFPALQAAVVEAVRPLDARLVLADNLYAYGAVTGPIDETTPERPASRKGRVRAAMARTALAALGDGRVAIVRGADFYGPEVLGSAFGERFFGPIVQGRTAHATGALDVPHAVTHVTDMAAAMVAVGGAPALAQPRWLAPTAAPWTQRALATAAAEAVGTTLRVVADGRLTLAVGGLFVREAWEVLELLHDFTAPLVVDSARIEAAFGLAPVPLAQGIGETVAWYRAHAAQG